MEKQLITDTEVRLDLAKEAAGVIKKMGLTGFAGAILFGSTAKHKANKHSDVDLACLFDRSLSDQAIENLQKKIEKELQERDIPVGGEGGVSITVFSKSDLNKNLGDSDKDSLLSDILTSGIEL